MIPAVRTFPGGTRLRRVPPVSFVRAMLLAITVCATWSAMAAETTRAIDVAGANLRYRVDPQMGGAITDFRLRGGTTNIAGEAGLSLEGFGAGSYYAPSRRINGRAEVDDSDSANPVVTVRYECQGPRIDGLHVERRIEFVPHASSLRMTWTIENRGQADQWVAPWVRIQPLPGGAWDEQDRIFLPTPVGIISPESDGFHLATRNWAAVTDAAARETFYAVFDAENLHSWKSLGPDNPGGAGLEAWFVPFALNPGESWSTTYTMALVRGVERVDFATERGAGSLRYRDETLTVTFAAAETIANAGFQSVLLDGDTPRALPERRFSLERDSSITLTYPNTPLQKKAYDFLAQVTADGEVLSMNPSTHAPHEGIDTRFAVGALAPLPAWTEGPYRLDRVPQTWPVRHVEADGLAIGSADSYRKVFAEDLPGDAVVESATIRISAARGEAESFQMLLRPLDESRRDVTLRMLDFRDAEDKPAMPVKTAQFQQVGFVPVTTPSHFENPTGSYPDPLKTPNLRYTLDPDVTTALWCTLIIADNTKPGIYSNRIDIVENDTPLGFIEIELTVYDFPIDPEDLPKVDVRLDEAALTGALDNLGFRGDAARDTAELLDAYRLSPMSGEETVEVARYPERSEWSEAIETLRRMRDETGGPASMVTVQGLDPFLADEADIWNVHLAMFDAPAQDTLLEAIRAGRRVWVHTHHEPGRPYPNFFIEQDMIEHRMLFWAAWALGAEGVHYWNAYAPGGRDPWTQPADATPANGNGVLIYPSPQGPLASLRLAAFRDGVEDFAWLTQLTSLIERAERQNIDRKTVEAAKDALDLSGLLPNLTGFSRNPEMVQGRREAIGRAIETLTEALDR